MNVQRQKPSEMRDTCTSIADELIFGKEIAKSVKCLKNTHTKKNKRFGFTSLLHCEKKNRLYTVLRNTRDNTNYRSIYVCIG